MRTTLILALLAPALFACKDKGKSGSSAGSGSAAPTAPKSPTAIGDVDELPTVATASAVYRVLNAPKPELAVLVAADGALSLAATPIAWDDLKRGELGTPKPMKNQDQVEKLVSEARALKAEGQEFLADIDNTDDDPGPGLDEPVAIREKDPPPPPEEDYEDLEEEYGGTGTRMALDEGRMGRKPSASGRFGRCGGAFAALAGDKPGTLARQCRTDAELPAGDVLDGYGYSILLASPKAKAAPLMSLLTAVELIGVANKGEIGVLRTAFVRSRDPSGLPDGWGTIGTSAERWIEVRIGPTAIDVEAVPDKAIQVAWATGALDTNALATAYDQAIASRRLDKQHPVDVLVSPEVDMQRLVDVLVALDAAGAKLIGLGPQPDAAQMALRGRRVARVETTLGAMYGDLDRKLVEPALPRADECYVALLATKADARGQAQVLFTIDKKGATKDISVTAFDPSIKQCLADLYAKVKFPAPASGNASVSAIYTMSN